VENQLIANRYAITEHVRAINEGNYYRAVDKQTQQTVLIRILDISKIGIVGPGQEDLAETKLLTQMENEKRIIDKLDHPNLLKIRDYGFDTPYYYHIYDDILFETLQDKLDNNKSLPITVILRYAIEIADTLSHLHSANIIHCDIKPENILIIDHCIRVIEFVIANYDQIDGNVPGTPPYMSPEAIQGEKASEARDIWSFGVTLYYLLTDKLPFGKFESPEKVPELFKNILTIDASPISDYRQDVPTALSQLIDSMLEKDPARRIDSTKQISEELTEILDELASEDKQG